MTLRKGKDGLPLAKNGQLVSGSSECGCCKCCWRFSGDEAIGPDQDPTYFLELDNGLLLKISSASDAVTLVIGPEVGTFCEIKWIVKVTVVDFGGNCIDGSGNFPPTIGGECETTGEVFIKCDCLVCPTGKTWVVNIDPCPDFDFPCEIPQDITFGGDCFAAYCQNPPCSDCSQTSPNGTGVVSGSLGLIDPDNSVLCDCPDQCPNYVPEGEEF